MPITLTAPEGLLSPEAQAQVFAGLTDALLEVAGLSGNAFMTANTIGTINVLPKERILAGGKPVGGCSSNSSCPRSRLRRRRRSALLSRRRPISSSEPRKAG
jgi:hypothetical protein